MDYINNVYPGYETRSGTARENTADTNYDVRKSFNAKLEGSQAKTIFKTKPRPAKTPDYKNHSRTMELPNDFYL